jgi:hypothetical protein
MVTVFYRDIFTSTRTTISIFCTDYADRAVTIASIAPSLNHNIRIASCVTDKAVSCYEVVEDAVVNIPLLIGHWWTVRRDICPAGAGKKQRHAADCYYG